MSEEENGADEKPKEESGKAKAKRTKRGLTTKKINKASKLIDPN